MAEIKASREYQTEPTIVDVNGIKIGQGYSPLIIAGPCAVESARQMMQTANAVREAEGHMLRGGAFKPRTNPRSFEGLGEEGLKYLQTAGKEYGLPIVTEATGEINVEKVALYSDVIQIGSRNSQNFELLKAAGKAAIKYHRAVLLKRGAGMSIPELLGAASYIMEEGCDNVMLCLRGVRANTEEGLRYRSDMDAIPLLLEETHLPIIYDPSHAAGRRQDILPQSLAAIAMGTHGLIVETHPDPDNALTDAKQQIPLGELDELVKKVHEVHNIIRRGK